MTVSVCNLLPSFTFLFFCLLELIEFDAVENISLANYDRGATVSISCSVESCASDLVLQLFKEDQLVHLKTRRESNTLTGSTQIKATEEVAGVYVYQAMSEKFNEVVRKSFSVTGKVLWVCAVSVFKIQYLLHRFSQDYLTMPQDS